MSTCPCISFTSLKHIVLCLSRRDLGVSHQKLINQFVFAKVTPLLSGTLGEHCHVLSGCPLHLPPPKCQPPAADIWVPNRPWGSLMFRPPLLVPIQCHLRGVPLRMPGGVGVSVFLLGEDWPKGSRLGGGVLADLSSDRFPGGGRKVLTRCLSIAVAIQSMQPATPKASWFVPPPPAPRKERHLGLDRRNPLQRAGEPHHPGGRWLHS